MDAERALYGAYGERYPSGVFLRTNDELDRREEKRRMRSYSQGKMCLFSSQVKITRHIV
ncbi:uncharacterized protein BT62DRAFT_939135 [Guyanagaster necrorhizus]|uniref:Uncharacterized protein n=1 Tax=Guyanagaster necrorhizus TaxID=856835 RepID=A0A9P8ALW8_9AGAR|nr:uncharacterized protein BT62DRAFT_939135 [Guyanagaster necrorhizus MCA 3950]KAG7439267.1 hypothetical protein BT62DRAFT_939135 [Guyanagaster necrorhizus MCA 3950]